MRVTIPDVAKDTLTAREYEAARSVVKYLRDDCWASATDYAKLDH